jgi:hypothetical protein
MIEGVEGVQIEDTGGFLLVLRLGERAFPWAGARRGLIKTVPKSTQSTRV